MNKQNRARTRATRQRMAETGESYTQAARAATTATTPAAPTDDRLSRSVRALLAEKKRSLEDETAFIAREEAAGHRIIDGGQTDAESWEITDWRTGEVIESGDGGMTGHESALDRLDPEGHWVHIDVLRDEGGLWLPLKHWRISGVPDTLIESMGSWLDMTATTGEIATLAGWSEQEVIEHLRSTEEG